MSPKSSRRQFLQNASVVSIGALPLSALAETKIKNEAAKLKVICVGGHPDDPES